MPKLPISIEKIITFNNSRSEIEVQETKYMVTLTEKNKTWIKHIYTDRKELEYLRNQIDKVLNSESIAQRMNVSEEKGQIIEEKYKNDSLCLNCSYQFSPSCLTCLFTLQSPLERKLYLELKRNYIYFTVQYGINHFGEKIAVKDKSYDNQNNNFKEVLTIVDFFIDKGDVKLCVYTDGHTYHERTEEQAQRDRKIDRKLQELGFIVLRYTGKDVNENASKIISDIKKWIKS
ncbi:DUF559 domain-containing protein [Flavobacterium sp. J49]|uniref:endonuclease domain-containing protein n=1 Tax=Flavobacterium sp. J49 TaxID=2718534 RepID=UPI001592C96A|nr:DUF559 domain-containing protein [Flavobacterium sp. J49]MBF6642174.1 DUF559 domain-containing protein [Flavobacterium sp. J49]NIC03421.1 DUF559 domain-containing protein [Flavobacterium sp. J49]